MFIESIILHNYRAYRGHNKTSFKPDTKNIFLVAGNNGFGKTTFLTSLVWCLYGKLYDANKDLAELAKEHAEAKNYKELGNTTFEYYLKMEDIRNEESNCSEL